VEGEDAVPTFGAPEPGVTYTERRAAYVVIANEQRAIATVEFRGKHFLPGGGSSSNETPENTVVREVREELAAEVVLIRNIGEAVQYFYASSDDQHYRMQAVFFAARFIGAPNGSGEHWLHWLPATEARQAFYHECHAWAVQSAAAPTPTE
jgi:ADP-ribose pyrophosphatase YjhB (NUDIX family)